ncbi:thioredoxin family protein [Micromonospora sp. DT81.3]|uniref:hypothetical protein n=1 Tax=Micromonospora sp. DT81.3 TaxID=3416523 RepID=UPI003CEBC448
MKDDDSVNIEVLHIDDCLSWVEAGNRLREALDTAGFEGTEIVYRVLRTAEDSARVEFAGSPTILLDGQDLFPGAEQTSDLACRVYPTPVGLAGTPTTKQLIDALASRGR